MIIHSDLRDFFLLLSRNRVDYVIVGGYAVAFHGFVRATKDIDVLFRNTPENIERLAAALNAFGLPISDNHKPKFRSWGGCEAARC